jgi:hypothetical protein
MPAIATSPYFDALTHLPPGGVLRFGDVSWKDAEQLLRDVSDCCHTRISHAARAFRAWLRENAPAQKTE